MSFSIFNHGETRPNNFTANQGKVNYKRTEKFCCKHGWIDLFLIGGELAWHRQHSDCDKQVESGAVVLSTEALTLKKAA